MEIKGFKEFMETGLTEAIKYGEELFRGPVDVDMVNAYIADYDYMEKDFAKLNQKKLVLVIRERLVDRPEDQVQMFFSDGKKEVSIGSHAALSNALKQAKNRWGVKS